MFFENENIQLNGTGLNGWWKEFWGGLKSAVGLKDTSDTAGERGGFWKRLGGFIGRKILSFATAGIAGKTAYEYNPTSAELVILNPIKIALNNWAFELMETVDLLLFDAQTNEDKISILNNAVREINIVLDYYNLRTDNRLSTQAYDYLIDSIKELADILELTIEDILDSNGINYTKAEVALNKQADDFYPLPQIYTTNFASVGNQYYLATNQNPIKVDAPIKNTTAPTTGGGIKTDVINPPKDVGTVVNNTNAPLPNDAPVTNDGKNNNMIVFGLFSFALLIALFVDDKDKKKSKTIKN